MVDLTLNRPCRVEMISRVVSEYDDIYFEICVGNTNAFNAEDLALSQICSMVLPT